MNAQELARNVRRLRVAHGLSQKALAAKAGLSLPALKNLELARTAARVRTLQTVAAALDVKLADLLKPARELKTVRFRSKKRMRNRENILAAAARWCEDFDYLENLLDSQVGFALKELEPKIDRGRPEEAAGLCRCRLGLKPDEPIHDLTGLLEHAGVKVHTVRVQSDGFFGLSIGEEDCGPAVVVNAWERITVERRIFSAAHELGHLLLHPAAFNVDMTKENEREEKEADRFAGHFLLPDAGFRKEWNAAAGLHWVDRVLKVKSIFRVSYKTVLFRLMENSALDNSAWKRFYWDYSRLYRVRLPHKEEPAAPGFEPGALAEFDFREDRFSGLVRKAVETEKISVSRGAEMLGCSLLEMRDLNNSWAPVL